MKYTQQNDYIISPDGDIVCQFFGACQYKDSDKNIKKILFLLNNFDE